MENKLIRKQNQQPNSLGMHRHSHTISKTAKPKIRIIHIFAPEIIKTDAENFRELVQKLTGKPSGATAGGEKKCPNKVGSNLTSSGSSSGLTEEDSRIMMSKNGFLGLDHQTKGEERSSVKEENGGSVCCGGYLGGFSDLEGFISEIEIAGFPMLPIPMDGTHHMQQMQGFEL